MYYLNLLLRGGLGLPITALCLASAGCVALVVARVGWTGNFRYAFLVWNLFLAWVPLMFALAATRHAGERPARNLRFLGFTLAWLLFFPNAPYICTDIIHLTRGTLLRHFWVDLSLVLSSAVVGLVVGFVSLYLMHAIVARVYGKISGWLFIALVAGLSGFGIYLGRFLRFNSWDVVVRPFDLLRGIKDWAANAFAHPTSYAFPILFAAFLFLSYVTMYALTHLRPPQTDQIEG